VVFVEMYFGNVISILLYVYIIKRRVMMIAKLQAFICIHYSNEYLVRRKRGILYFSFPETLFCVKTFKCKQQ